jgi:hypothetical protein
MPLSGTRSPAPFDEPAWLAAQQARARRAHDHASARLARDVHDDLLYRRLAARTLRGDGDPAETPVTFALCLAETLGLAGDPLPTLAAASALFWAAADTADDLDDRDVSGGLHPAAVSATANDACALLLLALRAYGDAGPGMAERASRYGVRMAAGQARDLASTDRPTAPDVITLAREKAGAELGLFFAQVAAAAGADADAFARLGEEFGVGLQLFSDVADLYLKAAPDDFIAGKWNLLLYYYRRDADQAAQIWTALDRTRPDVHARVRTEAAGAAIRSLAGAAEALWAAWRPLRDACADPAPFDAAVGWLTAALETAAEAVGELSEAAPPAVWSHRQAVPAAVRYLLTTEFAEEHRWGLFGKPFVRGDLFALLWRAAALRAADAPWRPLWLAIESLRDADGWRYFPHEQAIPPDADDAGLLLGYFGDVMTPAVRDDTVRRLVAGFEPKGIHTWLCAARGPVEWEGDDCPATLANAAWGLLAAGAARDVPRGVWRRLIAHAEAADFASPFYTPAPVRFFVHRALAAAVVGRALAADDTGAARRRLEADLAAAQRLAGNTADHPFDAACDLLAGAAWGLAPARTAAQWLAERQRIDGSWPETPVFRTPGIQFRPYAWGHPGLTTAFAVLALKAAQP